MIFFPSGTAFESEQLDLSEQSDFCLRIGLNQRALVKIQFICLVFWKGMDYHMIFKVALFAEGMVTNWVMYDFLPSETAFDSEQLYFNLKIWTKPKIWCENSPVSLKWL